MFKHWPLHLIFFLLYVHISVCVHAYMRGEVCINTTFMQAQHSHSLSQCTKQQILNIFKYN